MDGFQDSNCELLQPYLSALFENNTDAIALLTMDGIILNINKAFLQLGQFEDKTRVIGQQYERFVKANYGFRGMPSVSNDEVNNVDGRFFFITQTKLHVSCLMRKSPVVIDQQIKGYYLIIKNMVELDKLAEFYIDNEINYRTIAENMQDVLIIMDKDQNYLYVSPSSLEMFGFDHTKIENREAYFNIHEDYVDELARKFEYTLKNGVPFQMKLKAWHETKGWIWTEIKGKAVYDIAGKFKHMLLVARDITKEQEQQENLMYYAYYDNLTGLPNRRMFKEHMDLAEEQLKMSNHQFAVMIMDIDDFKLVNDSYGHEIGDEVITAFGTRVKEVVSEHGLAARLGGDEFVVLLNDVTKEQAMEIAWEINERVKEKISIQQTVIHITASIGVKMWDDASMTGTQALKQADDALYKGKELGKDQFSLY